MQHRGFETVAGEIAGKEGIPMDRARAILAKSSRKASKKARKKNPCLNKVKGK